jgi:hypothetical protein
MDSNKVYVEFYDGIQDGRVSLVEKHINEVKINDDVYKRLCILNRRGYSVFLLKKTIDKMKEA